MPLSTFCGVSSISTRDAEEVCESGGFIAEEVNGAGHKGSVQIQDNIMGLLGILDVIDTKPSGLGTIFLNFQSIRIFGEGASGVCVLPYFLVQYPLEQIPSTEIKSLAEFVCAFMLYPQTNFTCIYGKIFQLS